MSDPTRRAVLAATTSITLATMSPEVHAAGLLDGGISPMRARVAMLRERWARGAEELSVTLLVDRPDCGDAALRTDADTLRRGFAAVEIFKELELLSVEE